jgi:NAD(P)H-hydrate epimerase
MSDSPLRLTRAQVREIDRRSIEQYHIPGIVLMENAARGAVVAAITHLRRGSIPYRGPVLVVCGGGNNGGDGLSIARHLHEDGISTRILLATDPATYRGDALIEWKMAQAWKLHIKPATPEVIREATCKLIVDAIFGTGLNRAPEAQQAEVIEAINARKTRVLAIDVPSGLDCDTGRALGACVRATRTVTFVAEKAGFANPASKKFTGEIVVADIGCPRELIEDVARSSG